MGTKSSFTENQSPYNEDQDKPINCRLELINLIKRICEYLIKMHGDILKYYNTIYDKNILRKYEKIYYSLKDNHP